MDYDRIIRNIKSDSFIHLKRVTSSSTKIFTVLRRESVQILSPLL